MFSKTITALGTSLAMVAGLTAVTADARPTPKEARAQKSQTQELNRQQLASIENGGTARSMPQSASPGAMPEAMPAAGMNGSAGMANEVDPAAPGGPADPAAPGGMATPPEAAPPAGPAQPQ